MRKWILLVAMLATVLASAVPVAAQEAGPDGMGGTATEATEGEDQYVVTYPIDCGLDLPEHREFCNHFPPGGSQCETDGVDNNGNGYIDENGEPCLTTLPCDDDGLDNNQNGLVDEEGELCQPCDRDGVDSNGNGQIDEPGDCEDPTCENNGVDDNGNGLTDEPGDCRKCEEDGMDNNGDGRVDEPGEPCQPPEITCKNDGRDSNGNGEVDEPGDCEKTEPTCETDGVDDNRNGRIDEPGDCKKLPLTGGGLPILGVIGAALIVGGLFLTRRFSK